MAEHTELPWKQEPVGGCTIFSTQTINIDGRKHLIHIADCSTEANAEFIVLACNSYEKDQQLIDDLVDACEWTDTTLNACTRYFLGTGPQPQPEELAEVIVKLKAVLAAAEEAK
jgi:hypothetical protein